MYKVCQWSCRVGRRRLVQDNVQNRKERATLRQSRERRRVIVKVREEQTACCWKKKSQEPKRNVEHNDRNLGESEEEGKREKKSEYEKNEGDCWSAL